MTQRVSASSVAAREPIFLCQDGLPCTMRAFIKTGVRVQDEVKILEWRRVGGLGVEARKKEPGGLSLTYCFQVLTLLFLSCLNAD